MKSTGVTRKIDELGRIVIPKEIRKNLGIRDGESLEIYTDQDNIILRKHSRIEQFTDLGVKLVDLINNIFDINVIITDREKVIASSNANLLDAELDSYLLSLIDNRESYLGNDLKSISFGINKISSYFTIVPIISESDSLGLIIIESTENNSYEKIAKLMARIIVDKIDIY